MNTKSLIYEATKFLSSAGIEINGKNPWDIQVHDEGIYARILSGGSLALGESYMDGSWDVKQLDEFMTRILSASLDKKVINKKVIVWNFLKSKVINMQNKKRAFIVGKKHYDLGNGLYKNMLDKNMMYSCAYWDNAKTLDEAQIAKLDLICRKIGLKKGQRILDIGCGWGGFAKYSAEKYGATVVGLTISEEQAKYARENCKGLDVEIRVQDYRKLDEKFDHIISIGMFEHVGPKNYKKFMKIVKKNLKEDGLFLLHTIGGNRSVKINDPWIEKYIFPNSVIPSANQITKASEGSFFIEDWHNFGHDYDRTLMEWHKNFTKNWHKISDKYDERFYRMWTYYLLACAATFRTKRNHLWQIVLSNKGYKERYKTVR